LEPSNLAEAVAAAAPRARPTRADYTALREALTKDGEECAVAPYEAEAHGSWLARRGDVAAVFTVDGDALAYGAPIVVSRFGYEDKQFAVRLEHVLAAVDMSYETFRDACILCGTDFNSGIAGFGPAKIFALLGSKAGAKAKSAEELVEWGNRTGYRLLATPAATDWCVRVLPRVRRVFETHCGSGGALENDAMPPTPPPSVAPPPTVAAGARKSRKRPRDEQETT
jgi:hypothetical protein